ncbi:hypothetical protein ACUN0C_07620 [Faunimonas sp. B44]|uniref:hypothetical protein n=1 Tax=Faunimonas sp. B44 TaxID=3461493 RepID=UPI004043DC35
MGLSKVLRLATGPLLALALAACQGFGGGSGGSAPATEAQPLDVRRFIGPDYCPPLRVRQGTEVLRRFDRGRENDQSAVIWQASIGNTARECLYDGQGNLLIRVGVSGRVVAGPRGGPATVPVPLRIAVTRAGESVVSSNLYRLSVTIPPELSTVFTEVYEITVPSPGNHRDYLIYLGFDEQAKG